MAARKEFAKVYAQRCKLLPGTSLDEARRDWAALKTVCSDIKKKKKIDAIRAGSKSPDKRGVDSSENNRKSNKKKAKEVGGEDITPVAV